MKATKEEEVIRTSLDKKTKVEKNLMIKTL